MTKPRGQQDVLFVSSFVLADGEFGFSICYIFYFFLCFVALCSCCFGLLSLLKK
jgi:hypothetical protein